MRHTAAKGRLTKPIHVQRCFAVAADALRHAHTGAHRHSCRAKVGEANGDVVKRGHSGALGDTRSRQPGNGGRGETGPRWGTW